MMQLCVRNTPTTPAISSVSTVKCQTHAKVTPCRSTRVRRGPAAPQRFATSLSTTAQKTEQGQETAEKVDAKLDEVFDNIAEAEDKIAAGNLEQKTDMEERQKDPSFAEAKDALDLNTDDPGASTAPAGQEQGKKAS